MKNFTFTTKQKGYGRQGLFANSVYIMDVFPNVNEYFDIHYIDDSFYNEETDTYTDCNGNEIEEENIYTDRNEWLSEKLQDECESAMVEKLEDIINNEEDCEIVEQLNLCNLWDKGNRHNWIRLFTGTSDEIDSFIKENDIDLTHPDYVIAGNEIRDKWINEDNVAVVTFTNDEEIRINL